MLHRAQFLLLAPLYHQESAATRATPPRRSSHTLPSPGAPQAQAAPYLVAPSAPPQCRQETIIRREPDPGQTHLHPVYLHPCFHPKFGASYLLSSSFEGKLRDWELRYANSHPSPEEFVYSERCLAQASSHVIILQLTLKTDKHSLKMTFFHSPRLCTIHKPSEKSHQPQHLKHSDACGPNNVMSHTHNTIRNI